MLEAEEFLGRLRADFPDFRFVWGQKFTFRPPKTIVVEPYSSALEVTIEVPSQDFGESSYNTDEGRLGVNAWKLLLLHELGHATLGHRDFKTRIGRLRMEVAAWEKARELASLYGVQFDDELMETELDSYRDWVYQKSRCPRCGLTRYETPEGDLHCPRCENMSSR